MNEYGEFSWQICDLEKIIDKMRRVSVVSFRFHTLGSHCHIKHYHQSRVYREYII